jgi:hypothetical protein
MDKRQYLLALFFLLWAGACVLSHAVARPYVEQAQVMRRLEAEGKDPTAVLMEEQQTQRGAVLVIFNLPLFIGLGVVVRAAEPSMGPLYWGLVILGSVYIPFFLSLFTFFLFHAPQGPGNLPGVDWDDGSLKDEEDDD